MRQRDLLITGRLARWTVSPLAKPDPGGTVSISLDRGAENGCNSGRGCCSKTGAEFAGDYAVGDLNIVEGGIHLLENT